MNISQAKKRIEELSRAIEGHNHKYYVLSQPVIADAQYDALVRELVDLETQFPQLKTADSPTQRIGAKISGDLPPVTHQLKMMSLDNTYDIDELKAWHKRTAKILEFDSFAMTVELKIDGVSCSLIYRDGKLALGATRGDGVIGEDVTHNVKTIRSIPLALKGNVPTVFEVRGEVYMDKAALKELNEARRLEGQILFANPRNAASGGLKLLDSRLTANRRLKFFAHSAGVVQGDIKAQGQWEFLQMVKKMGVPVNGHSRLCQGLDEVIEFCQQWTFRRDSVEYEIDGVVIKVNDFALQANLGETAKSPRWAVAFKFPASQATSRVQAITFQVGRTGVITPVAQLDPVACAGVMISRATLHNFDEIKRLGVAVGDQVLIERAGDVIPKIVKVVAKISKHAHEPIPAVCPSCAGPIVKEKTDDVAYRCTNDACGHQKKRAIEHFASRGAMDIEGLGESLIEQLIDAQMVTDVADLYKLSAADLMQLELVKERKAANVLAAINQSKSQPLSKLLFALGIEHIGQKAAQTLASHFKTMDNILAAKAEDFNAVPDFGEVMTEAVVAFARQPKNRSLIKRLHQAGINMAQPQTKNQGTLLSGKTFVFTGELEGLARSKAGEMVEAQGGKVSSSVSKATDFVVAGSEAGSKLAKAEALGVKIINVHQFKEMIHE